ncbi:MAG: hypothetical protein M0027_16250 [Candidatus Dormibacteraeota bacterium]|nr:hypothetical protein [Candidatus Dormibacteraeota bacterium]
MSIKVSWRADGAWSHPAPEPGRKPGHLLSPRARLVAIDECLNQLEERHLKGGYIGRQAACHRVVAALVAATGGAAPEGVWCARTSYALHAALLDWQSAILDELIPQRKERFPDLVSEHDEWAVPRLRRVKRRFSRPRAAATGLVGSA